MPGSGDLERRATSPSAPFVDGATTVPLDLPDDAVRQSEVAPSLIEISALSAGMSQRELGAADTQGDEPSIAQSLHLRRDWQSSFATFIAGGVAGSASRTLTAPLDRIKLIAQEGHLVQVSASASSTVTAADAAHSIRHKHPSLIQVAQMIKADGGWRAFWRGNTVNCFKAGPEFALVFSIRRYLSSLYDDCVEREKKRKKKLTALWDENEKRRLAITSRELEERKSMMVEPEGPNNRIEVAGSVKSVDSSGGSSRASLATFFSSRSQTGSVTNHHLSDDGLQRERTISLEASILTPPFNRLGCISSVPQLAVNCTIGAVAGLGAQSLLYPLEVVKTRVVVSRCNEYRGGVAEIIHLAYRKGGVMEFYSGFVPNMVGIVVYRGLEMGLYSSAQQSIMMYRMQVKKMNRHEASLNSAEVGVVGMLSSTVAQTVSYPLNVIRTRLQTQGTNGREKKYTGMVDCMVKMIRNKGVTSLFSGLTANYLKAVPASSCTFVVFEWAQRILVDDD